MLLQRLGWTFVLGVLATVVLAVLVAVVTGTTASLTIVIALLGLTVTLILELISRLERRQEVINMAFRVAEVLEKTPDISEDLTEAVILAGTVVDRSGGRHYQEALKQVTSNFREAVESLYRGDLRITIGSGPVLSEQAALTKSTVRATSVVTVDEAWWSSPAGQMYAQASVDAMNRGVSVTRIYIFEGEPSPRMQDVMSEQQAQGTHVYAIDRQEVPSHLRINVVVFDERAVYDIKETDDPKSPVRMLYTNRADVQASIQKFEQLLQLIMQLDAR
jgi:hypothetical protein